MADQPLAHPLADPYGGKGPLILRITWAESSVALVLILMRTYTNAFIVKSFKWDYFWAILALVVGIITQAMLTVSVTVGLGNHIFLLEPAQIAKSLQGAWIGQCLLIQSIGFGKYAVIAFILRIQDRAHSRKAISINYALYFIGVSNSVLNVTMMGMILTSCSPAAKFWNSTLPGSCSHVDRTNYVGYAQGTWAAISDILLAVIPMFIFWDLKISIKMKIFLCLLMAGGFLAAVAGGVKTIYIRELAVETDTTYALSPLIIWAWTENWLVLILGSLPPLRPLFGQVFELLFIQIMRYRNNNHGYYKQNDSKSVPIHPSASKRRSKHADSERKTLHRVTDILRTTHVQVISSPKESGDDSNESLNAIERGIAF